MKVNLARTLVYSFAVLILTASFTLAQDSTKSKSSNKMETKMSECKQGADSCANMDMKGMKMKKMHMDMKSTEAKADSSIIRDGVIDLKAIDKNKDGKVYEDVMDYNVISDKSGTCPICGMTLKEVTLKHAKENLVKAGYKVK